MLQDHFQFEIIWKYICGEIQDEEQQSSSPWGQKYVRRDVSIQKITSQNERWQYTCFQPYQVEI